MSDTDAETGYAMLEAFWTDLTDMTEAGTVLLKLATSFSQTKTKAELLMNRHETRAATKRSIDLQPGVKNEGGVLSPLPPPSQFSNLKPIRGKKSEYKKQLNSFAAKFLD